MSEPSNGAWPFQEIPEEEGLDISAIFGDSSAAPQGDPFAPPAAAQSVPSSPTPVAQEITPAVAATSQPTTAPIAKAPVEAPAENPIAAAFEQKTAENTKKGLLEKPPVFYHKGVKEEIDDPSMTFEELRIRKSDDFTDLEEGKRVSWSVEYCGIRKEVKDPKGTTIISMKEMIERSREFLDALKKTKDKDPCCYVKPKVEMKTKGNAAYKGKFGTLEEARNSDKVICLIPSNDGRIYELRKMEQGEFIAPKKNVVDFSEVRAGFSPALPKIPAELMGQIIAFFRAFMTDHGENEAFAQIYWDKAEKRFFAYVPKQSVCKEEVEANLHDCPYARIKGICNKEAYLELAHESKVYPLPQPPSPQTQERQPCSLEQRHAVYSDMLAHLTLLPKHGENLLERGLSEERIRRNEYRSMPETERGRRLLTDLLRSHGHDLHGIPGFRTYYGDWTLSGPNGFLIPVRNKDGLIQGLKIRLDDAQQANRKYRWLSSRNLPSGTRSYSWVHVTGNTQSKRAFLTEGPLKGDVASFLAQDALFICIGGVNALNGLNDTVRELGVREVVEAMDMDQMTNPNVRKAILTMRKEVRKIPGIRYSKYTWNPAYKGVDDYLLSQAATM